MVKALSFARAVLFGITCKVRILAGGVGVDGEGEDIAAVVEDLLGAVAGVIVNIENGSAAVEAERLGSDGGIVEVAVAAAVGPAGMMTRRAGNGESRALTGSDRRGGAESAIR